MEPGMKATEFNDGRFATMMEHESEHESYSNICAELKTDNCDHHHCSSGRSEELSEKRQTEKSHSEEVIVERNSHVSDIILKHSEMEDANNYIRDSIKDALRASIKASVFHRTLPLLLGNANAKEECEGSERSQIADYCTSGGETHRVIEDSSVRMQSLVISGGGAQLETAYDQKSRGENLKKGGFRLAGGKKVGKGAPASGRNGGARPTMSQKLVSEIMREMEQRDAGLARLARLLLADFF